jgi:hypothetical protein
VKRSSTRFRAAASPERFLEFVLILIVTREKRLGLSREIKPLLPDSAWLPNSGGTKRLAFATGQHLAARNLALRVAKQGGALRRKIFQRHGLHPAPDQISGQRNSS